MPHARVGVHRARVLDDLWDGQVRVVRVDEAHSDARVAGKRTVNLPRRMARQRDVQGLSENKDGDTLEHPGSRHSRVKHAHQYGVFVIGVEALTAFCPSTEHMMLSDAFARHARIM